MRIQDNYGDWCDVDDAQDAYRFGWHQALCIMADCVACNKVLNDPRRHDEHTS